MHVLSREHSYRTFALMRVHGIVWYCTVSECVISLTTVTDSLIVPDAGHGHQIKAVRDKEEEDGMDEGLLIDFSPPMTRTSSLDFMYNPAMVPMDHDDGNNVILDDVRYFSSYSSCTHSNLFNQSPSTTTSLKVSRRMPNLL